LALIAIIAILGLIFLGSQIAGIQLGSLEGHEAGTGDRLEAPRYADVVVTLAWPRRSAANPCSSSRQ
jgi:hypothetical protein